MEKEFVKKEIWFHRDGLKIYSRCYLPQGKGPFPAVIMCHGFLGSSADKIDCAQRYAEAGFAACAFDFCGGSPNTKSDGQTTEMSVMTETEDLLAVFDQLKAYDFIKEDSMYLWGESQGGMVAALAAARLKDKVKGLILFYPALMIPDLGRAETGTLANVTDTILWDVPIGRCYIADVWDLDPFAEIVKYEGPVFICHGTADDIVPISYSERARDTYKNAKYMTVEGAGHGFTVDVREKVDKRIIDFLRSAENDD
ncbi:MAG: alpha/beta hydrolase [Lachnospiraceae bacterium]|nr:alpha/beta hydrolase [Lachnospiraceae bacterium]